MKTLKDLGKWARHYKFCRKCKTTKYAHRQKGLCVSCFSKIRYKKEKKMYQELFRDYYKKNKTILDKKHRDYYNNIIKNNLLKNV
jgi:NADH pyrophosphatase NudC (nudix superfamily)